MTRCLAPPLGTALAALGSNERVVATCLPAAVGRSCPASLRSASVFGESARPDPESRGRGVEDVAVDCPRKVPRSSGQGFSVQARGIVLDGGHTKGLIAASGKHAVKSPFLHRIDASRYFSRKLR